MGIIHLSKKKTLTREKCNVDRVMSVGQRKKIKSRLTFEYNLRAGLVSWDSLKAGVNFIQFNIILTGAKETF